MADHTSDQDPEEEAPPGEAVDARFAKIEAEQAEQGGKLDQILAKLSGGSSGEGKTAPAATAKDEAGSMADQVRRAVEAVGAEKEQKAAADQHAAEHQALKEMREKPPRESQAGWRGKLQKAMYGKDPA